MSEFDSASAGCVWAPCGHHLRQDVRESGQRPRPAQLQQGHPPRRGRATLQRQLQLLGIPRLFFDECLFTKGVFLSPSRELSSKNRPTVSLCKRTCSSVPWVSEDFYIILNIQAEKQAVQWIWILRFPSLFWGYTSKVTRSHRSPKKRF